MADTGAYDDDAADHYYYYGDDEEEEEEGIIDQVEKSEIRLVPLRFRRKAAIFKDYKQLRRYIIKNYKDKIDKLDRQVAENIGGKLEPDDRFVSRAPDGTRRARPL